MRFYITTPIYYVNAEPHLGHAYTTIAADIIARYHRQAGDDVFFLTGTDEHGNKVAQAAEERGLTPREHVDLLAPQFRALAGRLNAANDFFIRTTDPQHERCVQEFMERVRANGDIEKRTYGGLYCTACEGFYYERDLDDGKCPIHQTEPVWLEEENYYFLLSRYQDRLVRHFRDNPDWIRPRSRYNEALAFIEQGLDDISISRKSITWGIPVPWDDEQVIYVWVDALINYVSALTYAGVGSKDAGDAAGADTGPVAGGGAAPDPGARDYGAYWPANVHLMAKDILKFHAVIWPALLMSAGYELPEREFIHGYLLMGGEKMSKTRGNVLDPFAVIDTYGLDPLRFYLFREVAFGQDGVVSLEGFAARYANELANELGNLVSRTVSMVSKYRGGVTPAAAGDAVTGGDSAGELAREGAGMVTAARARFDELEITAAIDAVWTYVRRLNRYVEEQAPWKLAKDEAQAERLSLVLFELVAGLRLIALCLHPVMPAASVEILRRLGQPGESPDLLFANAVWEKTVPAPVDAAPPLFPRIETPD